jgi:hypothetical protein
MNRIVRFSSAAMGMVLLAGLAYYQGGMESPVGERDMMTGTAISGQEHADRSEQSAQDSAKNCGQESDPGQADRTNCESENP